MKRGGPLRRVRPLRRVSRKRTAERLQRLAVVQEVGGRDGWRCAAAPVVPWVSCGGPLDPHELAPRSVRPGGHLDPANVRLVCRLHHGWITDHPAAAHAVGLHRYSWEEQ